MRALPDAHMMGKQRDETIWPRVVKRNKKERPTTGSKEM